MRPQVKVEALGGEAETKTHIPDRRPGSVWTLRGISESIAAVRTRPDDLIEITVRDRNGVYLSNLLSRKDARLLAKRIKQCLDSTSKRLEAR